MTEYLPPNCCVGIQDGYGHSPGCQRAPAERVSRVFGLPELDEDITVFGDDFPQYRRTTVEQIARVFDVPLELFEGQSVTPPEQPTHTQDELLTLLDELLDNALHDDRCYIDPDNTTCVCVIGKVRAALPPCGAVYRPANPQRGDRIVTCHRNAHPASPDRHVF